MRPARSARVASAHGDRETHGILIFGILGSGIVIGAIAGWITGTESWGKRMRATRFPKAWPDAVGGPASRAAITAATSFVEVGQRQPVERADAAADGPPLG